MLLTIRRKQYYLKKIVLFVLLTIPMFVYAEISNMVSIQQPQSLNLIPKSTWKMLAGKNIYFGHQSVGSDILQGIEDLKKESPWLPITINSLNDVKQNTGIQLIHSSIGKNGDINSKNSSFEEIIVTILSGKVDIAGFKYCFLDFDSTSNIQEIFNNYKATIFSIKKTNPNIRIVHFTVPLTSNQTGIKAFLKNMFGKPVGGAVENVVRNKYNDLLKKEYAKTGFVFDLAGFESTNIDGSVNLFKYNEKYYRHLVSKYIYDGQHLNEMGKRRIAEQFVLYLVNISN